MDTNHGQPMDTEGTGSHGHGGVGLDTPPRSVSPQSDELIRALDHDSDDEVEADIARLIAQRRARAGQ